MPAPGALDRARGSGDRLKGQYADHRRAEDRLRGGYKDSRLYTERRSVREIEEQYGILRAQALTPRESLAFAEKLLGVR